MSEGIGWSILVLLLCAIGIGGLAGCPQYNVYSSEMGGKAELARAESNRQIAVREAQAKKDAAIMLAEAEVLRAEGVAKANKIIGESLKGNEAYLRYLWVDKLDAHNSQVIYVPTETGMPVLEAYRLGAK